MSPLCQLKAAFIKYIVHSGECYQLRAGVVCLQVKLCDPHLSTLEVRFSR